MFSPSSMEEVKQLPKAYLLIKLLADAFIV